MNCPKCKSVMKTISFEGIEVDRCVTCKGIWFDNMEHEDLKKMKGSESIDTGDFATGDEYNKIDDIDCPKCNVKMIKLVDPKQSHIWYESCHICSGVFFDAGEFTDFKEETIGDFFKSWNTPERK